MRTFASGATRDDDTGKPRFMGYLSPLVLQRYGEYMLKHQEQSDGETRAADNWKKGMPEDEIDESLMRHMVDVMMEHDGYESRDGLEEALCAIIFGASIRLHQHLNRKREISQTERNRQSLERAMRR